MLVSVWAGVVSLKDETFANELFEQNRQKVTSKNMTKIEQTSEQSEGGDVLKALLLYRINLMVNSPLIAGNPDTAPNNKMLKAICL